MTTILSSRAWTITITSPAGRPLLTCSACSRPSPMVGVPQGTEIRQHPARHVLESRMPPHLRTCQYRERSCAWHRGQAPCNGALRLVLIRADRGRTGTSPTPAPRAPPRSPRRRPSRSSLRRGDRRPPARRCRGRWARTCRKSSGCGSNRCDHRCLAASEQVTPEPGLSLRRPSWTRALCAPRTARVIVSGAR